MVQDEGKPLIMEYQDQGRATFDSASRRLATASWRIMQRPEDAEQRAPVPDGDMFTWTPLAGQRRSLSRLNMNMRLAGPQNESIAAGPAPHSQPRRLPPLEDVLHRIGSRALKRERIDKTMSRDVCQACCHYGPVFEDWARTTSGRSSVQGADMITRTSPSHGDSGTRRMATSDTGSSARSTRASTTRDGEQASRARPVTVEIDHRLGWSRRIDNRKVQHNRVEVSEKIVSFEETFNKLRTLSSLDIVNSFSASAQGEIAGIGGSVSKHFQTSSAHTEVETEKMNHVKKERIIDDTTVLDYPGPVLYDEDVLDDDGNVHAPSRGASSIQAMCGWSSGPSSRFRPVTPDDAVGNMGLCAVASQRLRLGGKLWPAPKGRAQE